MQGANALKGYAKYVASIGLVLPCTIQAVGLGNLHVGSYLNQPLKATIDLTLDEDTVLNGIKVRLASVDAFKNAGLDRPYRLSKLDFNTTMLDGKPVILITSQDRMSEPFLNVLLDVTWAEGQFYRAYAILLDPPGYELTSSTITQNSFNRNVQAYKANKQRYLATKHHTKSALTSTGVYGPTKSTDDLWDIALRYKPENASINQVMLGIVRLNPTAFINGNINALKQGVTLKLPSIKTIFLVDKNTAQNEVNAHMGAWKNKQDIEHVTDLSDQVQENIDPESKAPEQEAMVKLNSAQLQRNDTAENLSEDLKNSASDEPSSETVNTSEQEASQQNPIPIESQPQSTLITSKAQPIEPQSQNFKLNMAKPAEKEPLFDDFISIPPMLKQIVKPQAENGESTSNVGQKSISVDVKPKTTQSEAPLSAEVAVAVSAIETVKESNQLLRQQVEGLLKQNELLKQQITVLSKQDNQLTSKIDAILKVVEKDYQITSDGQVVRREGVKQSSQQINDGFSVLELFGLICFLALLAVGGSFAFLYSRQKQKKTTAMINDDVMSLYAKEHLGQTKVEQPNTNNIGQKSFSEVKTPEVKTYYKAEISVTEDNELPLASEEVGQIVESSKSEYTVQEVVAANISPEVTADEPTQAKDEHEYDLLDLEFEYKDKSSEIVSVKEQQPKAQEEFLKGSHTDEPVIENANGKKEFDLLDLEFEYTAKQPDELDQKELPRMVQKEAKNPQTIIDDISETEPKEFDLLDLEFEYTKDVPSKSEAPKQAQMNKSLGEGLSLVVEDDETEQPDQEQASAQIQQPPVEKVNVSTQIALAETYIAMEDWQSANESLELVLKQGNDSQIAKAKQLLKKIP